VKLGVNLSCDTLYKLLFCVTDERIRVRLFGCHGCQEMAKLQWQKDFYLHPPTQYVVWYPGPMHICRRQIYFAGIL